MSDLVDDLKLDAAQDAFDQLARIVGRSLDMPDCDVLSAMIFAMADLAARAAGPGEREALRRELPGIVAEAIGRAFDRAGKSDDLPALTDLMPLGRA